MTTPELSPDAMREIKSRRDALARMQDSAASEEQARAKLVKRSAGVRAFMSWFARQRQSHALVMSSDRMLDVQPSLSGRFSIGLLDMRYYIAIPEDCREWFFEMPWLHAAVSRDSSVLSLVCERSRVPDASLPEFAMNFNTDCASMLKMLSNYHYLDVRLVTGASRVDKAGCRSVSVSKDVFMTLDIRVVQGERTFDALLDGRRADGFSTRSVTRAKAPSYHLKPLDVDPPSTPLVSIAKAR